MWLMPQSHLPRTAILLVHTHHLGVDRVLDRSQCLHGLALAEGLEDEWCREPGQQERTYRRPACPEVHAMGAVESEANMGRD